MDMAAAIGILLGLIALGLTVTPQIQNWWVASLAWLATGLYTVWFLWTRYAEVEAFAAQNRTLVIVGSVASIAIVALVAGQTIRGVIRKKRDAKEVRRREFESFPAELGIVDHGVNTSATLEEAMRLLHLAAPAIAAVFNRLYKRAPALLSRRGFRDTAARKQAIHKESAELLREHVLLLEDVARQLQPQATAFVDAYRNMFTLPVASDADRTALRDLRVTYTGGVASSFRQCADLSRARARDVALMSGKQQDLTRVVVRAAAAMNAIAESSAVIADFCSTEMPDSIDRILQT